MFRLIPSLLLSLLAFSASIAGAAQQRPNILFAMADDWGWPHAGAYGDPVVKTPTFDRIAREGILFHHAYVSSPSCTPCRGSILTGQWHWRLEEGGNLWSTLPAHFPVYPEIMAQAGYHTGHMRKAWGPGLIEPGGRTKRPAGPRYKNFATFLKDRPADAPFCFWLGASDPHRPYVEGSGVKSGMQLEKIRLPACFPDHTIVRSDIADYYFEVQRFDNDVRGALELLEKNGELENTIVVMTGDHGMPFPRCKSNLYDTGTRVPLAIRWGKRVKPGRVIDDFVSLIDLAPTFLEAAGIKSPKQMTGRSLMNLLSSTKSGKIDPARQYVLAGKERHVPAQQIGYDGGYPCRMIRTHDFLYIRNFKPHLWPAGVAEASQSAIGRDFADCDAGPTKVYMVDHQNDPSVRRYFDLSFALRPAEELYDLASDADQLINVASKPEYAATKQKLSAQLMADLKATADPRVVGGGDKFDKYPYYGRRFPPLKKSK